MKFYFAPMEGITIHTYRNLCNEMFPYIDKFFSPFLVTKTKTILNAKELRDISPENNQGLALVPQVLTNHAKDFIQMIQVLEKLGYQEVNLNLGCPSGTVVSKGRGAGFLAKPQELDEFLQEVFDYLAGRDTKLSVKTRIGRDVPEEFAHLLEIYNKYPIAELIIHPRTQKDYYKNQPNLQIFEEALANSTNPVCYNGNLFTVKDYERITEKFPQLSAVMLGRGLVCNPALAAEIQGRDKLTKENFREFHDRIYHEYQEIFCGEKNILFRMKELWCYMIFAFSDCEKQRKKIMKSRTLLEYQAAVNEVFRECGIDTRRGFPTG
ncbi:MAG: tRNA-dihydrouridine synthase family protein [Lachnospiraceae bacterium]|nr:tRNA-dihydrouridine synthase family protein [Lachnospiraceae bacterium]